MTLATGLSLPSPLVLCFLGWWFVSARFCVGLCVVTVRLAALRFYGMRFARGHFHSKCVTLMTLFRFGIRRCSSHESSVSGQIYPVRVMDRRLYDRSSNGGWTTNDDDGDGHGDEQQRG